ncbi:hypothetical protein LC087_08935 [Bacillus carboniphilus]|uniref:DUF4025 domain-containing protein n=1 Tax=Bacillus carboniphilus TaxID=86663 RepID=A0ABY9K324_9BACI|nr:hypothetical protein [Bacillus carboniphilus]WLR44180.1 hypothetical protein LC087_08935 [Bacillus carboniphilus]
MAKEKKKYEYEQSGIAETTNQVTNAYESGVAEQAYEKENNYEKYDEEIE